jgi:hypothetical protein
MNECICSCSNAAWALTRPPVEDSHAERRLDLLTKGHTPLCDLSDSESTDKYNRLGQDSNLQCQVSDYAKLTWPDPSGYLYIRIHACIHIHIHSMHTYIHAYIHTYISVFNTDMWFVGIVFGYSCLIWYDTVQFGSHRSFGKKMLPQSSGYVMEGVDSSETSVSIYRLMHGFTPNERAILEFTALETSNRTEECNYIVFVRLISEGTIVFGPKCYALA